MGQQLRGLQSLRAFKAKAVLVNGIAFAAVGVASCIFVGERAVLGIKDQNADEVSNIARLAAQQVDVPAHDQLKSADDMQQDSYWLQVERLAKVFSTATNIDRVYSVKVAGRSYVYVLDPTPPIDRDGDGRIDQHRINDPVTGDNGPIREAYRTGLVQTSVEGSGARRILRAYAPVLDPKGQVAGVVGVDRRWSFVESQIQQVTTATVTSCVAVAILAFLVALATNPGERGMSGNRSPAARKLRRRLLNVAIVVAVSVIVLDGAQVSIRFAQLRSELEGNRQQRLVLSSLEKALRNLEDSKKGWRAELQAVGRLPGSKRTSGMVFDALSLLKLSDAEAQKAARPILARVHVHHQEGNRVAQELQEEQADITQGLARVAIVALVLAVGCVTVLYLTSNQEEQLQEVVSENNQVQNDYGRLIDSMPVCLFGFAGGQGRFHNRAWSDSFEGQDEQDQLEVFLERVHPVERPQVAEALRMAESSQSPASFNCRLMTNRLGTRMFETRVIPVHGPDGAFRHMLSFSIDVTNTFRAEQELRAKNSEVEQKNQLLSRALAELEDNLESIVGAMVRAIEAKDIYTAGHSERVMQYSVWMGAELGLGPYEMRILELGSLVHDIGKIGVPDAVLTKPGKLTDEEFRLVQAHPALGANIMGGIKPFEDCIPIIRWHHEKLDGTGYPDGIAGDQIPMLVRIATVADIFDAMTSSRAYRKKIGKEEVLEIMRQEARDGKIDGVVLQALVRVVQEYDVIPQRQDGMEQAA